MRPKGTGIDDDDARAKRQQHRREYIANLSEEQVRTVLGYALHWKEYADTNRGNHVQWSDRVIPTYSAIIELLQSRLKAPEL